jgi:hypothetical protein
MYPCTCFKNLVPPEGSVLLKRTPLQSHLFHSLLAVAVLVIFILTLFERLNQEG